MLHHSPPHCLHGDRVLHLGPRVLAEQQLIRLRLLSPEARQDLSGQPLHQTLVHLDQMDRVFLKLEHSPFSLLSLLRLLQLKTSIFEWRRPQTDALVLGETDILH